MSRSATRFDSKKVVSPESTKLYRDYISLNFSEFRACNSYLWGPCSSNDQRSR